MTRDPDFTNLIPSHSAHSLETLVTNLREYLGTGSGIDSADTDVTRLRTLLEEYQPAAADWEHYGKADPSRNYTRLLIDSINGKSNLVGASDIPLEPLAPC